MSDDAPELDSYEVGPSEPEPLPAATAGSGAAIPDAGAPAGGEPDPQAAAQADAVGHDSAQATPKSRMQGGLSEIEDGIAHLFAAFERGVINIADAEAKKRRAANTTGSGDQGQALPTDDTVTQAGAETSPKGGGTRNETGVHASTSTAPGRAAESEPVTPRPGMTYDEVLKPIRWRAMFVGVLAVAALGALYWAVSLLQVIGAADDVDSGSADAIVVLGAAQFDGTPSPVFASRLDQAIELWRDGRAQLVITTGSNQQGDRFTEGFSGFVHLREAGVPEPAILTIVDGDDSYQQLTAAQAQLHDRGLDTALLVSDGYHTFRLRSIADEIGLSVIVSPTALEATTDDYLRESTAVSLGRLISYRRLSAWATSSDEPVENAPTEEGLFQDPASGNDGLFAPEEDE